MTDFLDGVVAAMATTHSPTQTSIVVNVVIPVLAVGLAGIGITILIRVVRALTKPRVSPGNPPGLGA
jgi:hypothetical protein